MIAIEAHADRADADPSKAKLLEARQVMLLCTQSTARKKTNCPTMQLRSLDFIMPETAPISESTRPCYVKR